MTKSESRFIRHEPCPQCGSRDACAVYDDGHRHCFSCGYHSAGDGMEADTDDRTSRPRGLLQGEPQALSKRHLTEETTRLWGYHIGPDREDRKVQIANYRSASGDLVAQKVRYPDKSFTWTGSPKDAAPLYGMWLWRDGGKMLVITEGELDALSVSQAQGNKWPVVSVKNGAQSAVRDVAAAIEWVEKFDKVILAFDMDKPGREAAAAVADLLTPGKAYIVSLPEGMKDASDMVQAGRSKDLIDALWGAKEHRPDGIVDIDDVAARLDEPVEEGRPWPWPALTLATRGRRYKELYGLGAGVGIGKTELFKQLMAHILQTEPDAKIGVLLLEEDVVDDTLRGIAGKLRGDPEAAEMASRAELEPELAQMRDRVFLYDHFGSKDYETIRARIIYMVQALGAKDIFLDHMTALISNVDDERRALDHIMADLAGLAQRLDFTLYFISHLTTPDGKPHEEGGRVYEKHFTGSRAIARWSHVLFALEGDKQDRSNMRLFRILKHRKRGSATGVTFGLHYDATTGLMSEAVYERSDDNDDGNKDF
jgi:twinkle protein